MLTHLRSAAYIRRYEVGTAAGGAGFASALNLQDMRRNRFGEGLGCAAQRPKNLAPNDGLPVVLFDKCIGRKRNAGGGVLAGPFIFGCGPFETSAVLRLSSYPFASGREARGGCVLGTRQ